MDAWEMLHGERDDFADLLDTLSPSQWEHDTLCEGWTAKEVTAHVIQGSGVGSPLEFGRAFVRSRFNIDRFLDLMAREQAAAEKPDELAAGLRKVAHSRKLPPLITPAAFMFDVLVHNADIRIPLGIPRETPPEHLVIALDATMKSKFFKIKQKRSGLRLHATDIGWSIGDGPEVRGPAEAFLLTLTGRRVGLERLEGEGLTTLRARL